MVLPHSPVSQRPDGTAAFISPEKKVAGNAQTPPAGKDMDYVNTRTNCNIFFC
jgi:hypothetical protein